MLEEGLKSSSFEETEPLQTGALPSDSKPRRVRLYFSVFILNIVFLLCGCTFCWSSPMMVKLQLPDSDVSIISAMLPLGSVTGPYIPGVILKSFGRKSTTGISMIIMTVSWLLLAFNQSFLQLCVGRLLSGMVGGFVYASIFVYIAEISEDSIRGPLNMIIPFSCCSGMLLVFAISPFVSYVVFHYILLGICALFFLLFPLLPESPYFLLLHNDVNGARDTLTWLRDRSPAAVEKELLIMQETVQQDMKERGTVKDLFTSKGNRRALTVCVTLVVFVQLTGVPILSFYMEQIFIMTGSNMTSSTCSIISAVIMVVTSPICPVAVKYFGYRKPMMASVLGMGLTMASLGMFFLLRSAQVNVDSFGWVPLLSIVLYILSSNAGFANIPWALMGELFPSNIRHISSIVVTNSCDITVSIIVYTFLDLANLIGIHFVFFICSLSSAVIFIFILLVVPETSGLSFAEINGLLTGRNRKDEINKQPEEVSEAYRV